MKNFYRVFFPRGHRRLLSAVLVLALFFGMSYTAAPAAAAPSINAAGAIVMDYETGEVYYEKAPDVARPAASMTKVMSCYLVFEEIAAGRLSLDSRITASKKAARISNDPSYSGLEYLSAGGSYQVDTLLRLIMTASCNGSVVALAEHISGTEEAFTARMNAKAQEWGIDAHFADCTGFTDEGNAVSPRAMAVIARRIIADYPEILTYSALPGLVFQGRNYTSTNTLLRNGTCEGIDGLKSGTTYGAGNCYTGTAQRSGRRIISVVMGMTSHSARMNATKALLDYGFQCRWEREEQWRTAAKGLQLTVAAQDGPVWSYVPATLTATVSGVSTDLPCCKVSWEVNGETVGGTETVTVKNGEALSTVYTSSGALPLGQEIPVSVTLTLPDGTVERRSASVTAAKENVKFQGHLGIKKVEMYPEASLTIPFRGGCAQGLSLQVPAGWYLDGEPIPEYQNGSFSIGPDSRSCCTIRENQLSVGTHTLEFRLNTWVMPGIEQAAFSAQIVVLADGQEAQAALEGPERRAA